VLDDQQLLRRYVTDGSEAAFGELVARYVDLVYSTALRRADGDAHLAQDVAQLVFTDLARKARSLPKGVVLPGWLHRASRYATAQLLRTERRHRAREQEAVAMNTLNSEAAPDWGRIHPLLDEALDELGPADRDALVLRFFDQRSLAEVGHALGSNEEAARKRVARALEKLRASLVRRGVTTTAAALSTVLAMNAVQGAPAGLAATLTSASLASAVAGTGTALGIMEVMTMTKLKAGIIGAVIVASVLTPLVIQHQAQVKLREENQSLRQQVDRLAQLTEGNERLSHLLARSRSSPTPRLPAPPMQATAPPSAFPTEDLQSTNLIARFKDKDLKLTIEQVESYLKANRRNAASLLAAYRTTGNPALLEEAMQKYPNDPQVDFEAVFKKDASPEQRRQWLDAFKQSAPDNALVNYLSALDYAKADQTDQAVQELIAADGKAQFQDYTLDRVQGDEEAYLAAGYSVAEAKALAASQLPLPYLQQLRDGVRDYLIPLANSYRQAGDMESAQAALQMGVNLAQRYGNGSPGEPLISQLVGLAVERMALSAMDPNSPYSDKGQTVQDRINQIDQSRAEFHELAQQFHSLVQTMSDQDWINFMDRQMIFGAEVAMRWVVGKYGQK